MVPEVYEFEADPEALPLPPEKFPVDRYKPLKEIGGGMAGAVYLCRDLVLNKKVAVKTLRRLTPEQLVAFQQEAKASSRLSHPGIVQVLDFGATESGDPFMVMEYIDGVSLDQYMQEHGVLRPAAVINIMQILCSALTVAHENGIFHRDLKPSNILVKDLGNDKFEARLIDFGLARMTAGEQETTLFQGRSLVGSPFYMSPDQANGTVYDARCEVYSLGCLMYELLTGHCPFQGETALNTLYMHVNEPAPKLSDAIDETFPERLEQVVAHCLEKQPAKRYQTTAELQAALAPDPVAQQAAEAAIRTRKSRLAMQFGIALVAITALFGVVANLVLHPPSKVPEAVAIKQFKNSKKEKKVKEDSKELGDVLSHAMTGFTTIGSSDDTYFGAKGCRVELDDILKKKTFFKNFVFHDAGLTDKDIEDIASLKPFTVTMDDCGKLTDRSLVALSKLPRLERLIMDDAPQITTEGLKALNICNKLEFISMRNSGLTDEDMKVMANYPQALHKLNVSNNPKITSIGVEYFKNRGRNMDLVVENCSVLMPAIKLQELQKKYDLTVLMEDQDTFDFNVFDEALNEKDWKEDDNGDFLGPPKEQPLKAD